MGVYSRRQPDLRRYRIEVVRDGSSELVVFVENDGPAGSQADVGGWLGSKPEQDAREQQVPRAARDRLTVLDTIQGTSFLAVQAAMQVFQHHNPELSQYRIEVVREKDSVVVMFIDKDRQLGTKGSLGPNPEFEVELNADDLRVVRSNFVR